jgi:phage terminase large subunit GpA-like protein
LDNKPGGAVAEAARMNAQRQVEKKRKRLGPKVTEADSIQARFRRFHEENPEVYSALVRMARRIKGSGQASYSIAGIYEVARFDRYISTEGKPFKLSNDYRSRYARLIMETEPDLAGFFTLRELRSL